MGSSGASGASSAAIDFGGITIAGPYYASVGGASLHLGTWAAPVTVGGARLATTAPPKRVSTSPPIGEALRVGDRDS